MSCLYDQVSLMLIRNCPIQLFSIPLLFIVLFLVKLSFTLKRDYLCDQRCLTYGDSCHQRHNTRPELSTTYLKLSPLIYLRSVGQQRGYNLSLIIKRNIAMYNYYCQNDVVPVQQFHCTKTQTLHSFVELKKSSTWHNRTHWTEECNVTCMQWQNVTYKKN